VLPLCQCISEIRFCALKPDVLHMVAQGARNAEIAEKLGLGEKTVRNYVSRLYHKLALSNRAQVAAYALHTDIEGDEIGKIDSSYPPTTQRSTSSE